MLFIFIASCIPENNSINSVLKNKQIIQPKKIEEKTNQTMEIAKENVTLIDEQKNLNKTEPSSFKILNEIEIILPQKENNLITQNLINSFELSVYKKQINNIQLNINEYYDAKELENILLKKAEPGKIFIGTLSSDASKLVKNYCAKEILFFSFSSNKNLASDCVYLINFFPEDDLNALFNYFKSDSKIALLFPENYYGNNINESIDPIASKSKSLIINRASYKEDLSDARESIKELSKYEIRKYELQRQKDLLKNKKDQSSIKKLKKIEKFETLGEVDFTHLILPDYGIRLLEIAPLLPFYDIDPNLVQFVGTGVWDDNVFFDEPALQGAIFPGIEEKSRADFFNDYFYIYKQKPIRTATIPYDLVGLISYVVNRNMDLTEAKDFLSNEKFVFEGIDGKFYFSNNVISRKLDILKISSGAAIKLN